MLARRFLGLLTIATLCCLESAPVVADDPATMFDVQWLVSVDRTTYFIGENITVSLEARAALNLAVPVPGQYAYVTIQNETQWEVWDAWVVTDDNGSANASWRIPLTLSPGNYTLTVSEGIFTDEGGLIATVKLVLLFDEQLYWQFWAEDMERQIDDLRDRQSTAFAWIFQLDQIMQTAMKNMWILGLVALFAFVTCAWVAGREFTRLKDSHLSPGWLGGFKGMMGFKNVPDTFQTEDHEEVAQLEIPEDKIPPRFGLEFACPLCDEKGEHKMTRERWLEHWLTHERKMMGVGGWRRKRRLRRLVGLDDSPADGSVRQTLNELHYKARTTPPKEVKTPLNTDLEHVKMIGAVECHENILLRKKKGLAEPDEIDAELAALRVLARPLVYKHEPPAKVQNPPKPLDEKRVSAPGDVRVVKPRRVRKQKVY